MRGEIKNVARKQQINDFSELRFKNITPTDLDGVIEYKNRAYVFFELKYEDAELPYGQQLCLERLVIDTQRAGKDAIAAIIQHDIHDVTQSIPVANCMVRKIFYKPQYKWKDPKYPCTALHLIKKFFEKVDKG